ncbi:hypothetical protein CsSME_00021563 [Camellia sinensis var. sinensis]
MAIITALLERSLQNCSLYSNIADDTDAGGGVGFSSSSSSSDSPENHLSKSHDAILDLNSHLSLPYYWEQCLDLKVHFSRIYIHINTYICIYAVLLFFSFH